MNQIKISSGLLIILLILIGMVGAQAQSRNDPNMSEDQITLEEILRTDYDNMPPYKQNEIDDNPTMFKVVDRLQAMGNNSKSDKIDEVAIPEEILYDEYNAMPLEKKEEIDSHPELFKLVTTLSKKPEGNTDQKIKIEEIPEDEYLRMPTEKREEIDNHPNLFKVVAKPSNPQKVGEEKQ